jgi:hypothetical protein
MQVRVQECTPNASRRQVNNLVVSVVCVHISLICRYARYIPGTRTAVITGTDTTISHAFRQGS